MTTSDLATQELQLAETEARLNAADSSVKGYVITAMALGLVPMPVFDVVTVTGLQLKMINSLSAQYHVNFSAHLARSLVMALLGGALPVTATVTASSLLKLFPGIGHLAGGASVSILSGASTYAVGRVFIQHFESGGTLLDFNPQALRGLFRRELGAGKTVAAELSQAATAPG